MSQIRSSSTSSGVSAGQNPIAGFVGLAIFGVGIWCLVCATRLIFAAIELAWVPPSSSSIPGLAVNMFENAICGLMAALAIGILQAWGRKPGKLAESFLSALFNGGLALPELNATFWGKVALSGSVGWFVGRVAGAAGMIALPPTISSSASTLFSSHSVPLVIFLGGGLGGPGGTDFWSLAFLFLVVLITVILLAVLVSTLLHIALYGVAGTTKGAVKAYILELIGPRVDPSTESENQTHPVVVGMQRGFVVGVIVGTIEAVFSAWGAATLHR